MRSRSNSVARLDYYRRIISKTILVNQNPITGLFPASTEQNDAWVRDNVYCILAVWSLSMAYRKNADLDEDCAKAYELEQCCVKSMRGLLMCMMMQVDKVEKFKTTQSPIDCLHAKYSSSTSKTVVGDHEWGHLQIDATSLFILALAQLTASGLQVIFNLDEVAFVQNLVFYIEAAYRIPDYGIWERGDKTNHGLPELNASSIGMAKAALEAINELDLFGARGGPASVIYVLADEIQNCAAVLQSMLPRESTSKEVDASLLSIISFPAFAVDDPQLIEFTRETVLTKLRGRYGFKRFLRDGHRTAKEDPNRLYYEPWELKVFENIECEWPMFYCYLILDGLFNDNKQMVDEYSDALEKILIKTEDGLKLVPELYVVPIDRVEYEYKEPHSQDRCAIGKLPYMWGQALYIIGKLVLEGFLAVGELDPLNRRLTSEKRPDIVVQVVLIAEDEELQEKLQVHDLHVQTLSEIAPVVLQPARVLSHIYARLGKNSKLSLSGRPSNEVGVLSTSKLYILHDRIFVFTPQFLDLSASYLARDISLLTDIFRNEIAFLKANWRILGRPTMTVLLKKTVLERDKIPPALLALYKKMKSGYSNGCRVILGNLQEFLSTSCVTKLTFLGTQETGDAEGTNEEVKEYLNRLLMPILITTSWLSTSRDRKSKRRVSMKMKQSVSGIIRRTKSIQVDPFDSGVPLSEPSLPPVKSEEIIKLRAKFNDGQESDPSTTSLQSPGRTPPISPTTSMPSSSDSVIFGLQVYENVEIQELVQMLQETDSLKEQADIIHYLYITKGTDWKTEFCGSSVIVEDLLKELYDKACQNKKWLLVRHTAGILGKRVEDLAKAITDLLVRQKQLTVGMPPYNEKTITRPLPPDELRTIIREVYGMDRSTAMLTQELLVYLAMFIRTEPQLFNEMLRLRVGLIIQVMASELARALNCTGEEAADFLLNLSPFELKTLLHHILSGKEFGINQDEMACRIGRFNKLQTLSSRRNTISMSTFNLIQTDTESDISDKQGQWLRRRRLDGSLNRVPTDFYSKIWLLLERCHGLIIEGAELISSLTREMTPGELKFALHVETVLNRIPYPEYRQLLVEAIMVLTLIVENDLTARMDEKLTVENLVYEANRIFLIDQFNIDGEATTCCAINKNPQRLYTSRCGGAAGICQYLYDSAPSGRYGSMTYLCKATAGSLNYLNHKTDFDCALC